MDSWTSLSTSQKVAVTIGVSAGVAVLYICYTKYRDGRALSDSEQDRCELRMRIPQHAVKLFMGQDGAVQKLLGSQTDGHIEVSTVPSVNGDQELTIKGSPTRVHQAQQLVYGILKDNTILQVELHLPAKSMGRVIGQGGERIREIGKTSGAKIQCEGRPVTSEEAVTRRITVTGTQEQVEAAKTLIQKVSEEEVSVRQGASNSSTFRSSRKEIIAVKRRDKQPPDEVGESGPRSPCSPQTEDSAGDGTLVPSPDFNFQADEYVDVYVSASENPEHFWIQILGSRSSQLDKLTTEMSDHYQRQTQGQMTEIQVGDIVAAQFQDQNWYRAEMLGFLENGNVDLYYVDYGDNWDTPRERLFPLRSDFLSLPFQAVECSLSGISPAGGKWSEKALSSFDGLSHCAQWNPLQAKISSFPSPGISRFFQIRLYDPSTEPMLDIGEELIRRGFAVPSRVSPQREDEEESLVSRLMEEVANLSLEPEACSFASRQDKRNVSGESIEILRADVDPSPEHQLASVSTPLSCLESVGEGESLEQSMAKIQLSSSGHSTITSSSSSSGDSSAQNTSSCGSSSTCTASEEQSFVSSSCEDSSVYSPRGCFYYMTDEVSTSSLLTSSSGEVITISSDSEGEAGHAQTVAKDTLRNPEVSLSSASDDVIVVEDDQ